MKLVYVVFLSFLSFKSFGQRTVSGKIATIDGIPLKYSTIDLKKGTVSVKTTSSDSAGNYRLSELNSGVYSISVSYLNYKKAFLQFRLSKDTAINFILRDTIKMLNEVVVTSNTPSFIRKADRFVFTPNNLLAKGSSGLEVLQHTPLIKFDAKSEVFAILNRQNTVIYINNKKTSLPREMIIEMLKALPAENIKNVEIITNPGSQYDGNITGGIININIKRQLNEGWFGNMSLTTQQSNYNTSVLNGTVSYRKGKIAFQIIPFLNDSYNYNTQENNLDYTNGLTQKLSSKTYRRYLVAGGGVNLDYDIDKKNSLSYKGWISHIKGNSTTTTTTLYSKANSTGPDSLQRAPYKGNDTYLYNFGNINYHRSIDSTGSKYLDANIDYNQFTQKNFYNGSFDRLDDNGNFVNEISRYRNQLPQSFFNLSEKAEYGQPINKSTDFSIGIQHSNTHVNNNLDYKDFDYTNNAYNTNNQLTNNYGYKEIYSAAFVSLSKNFNSKLSVSIGLRFENTHYRSSQSNNIISANNVSIDTSYFNLFPSASISYAKNQQNQFSLSFSKKITRPGIESLFPGITYYTPTYFNQNNPFLQPIIYYKGEFTYTLKSNYNFIFDYSVADHAYSNFTIPFILNNVFMLKSTSLNYGIARSFDFAINANLALIKDIWDSQITPTIDYSLYKSSVPEVSFSLNNFNYSFLFDNTIYISKIKQWTGFVTFTYTSKVADISGRKINAGSHVDLGIKKVLNNRVSVLAFANDIYKGNSIIKYYATPNPLLLNNYQKVNNYTQSFTLTLRVKLGNVKLKQTRNHSIANEELKNRAGQ